MSNRIRAVALCLLRQGNRILVNEAHDPVKQQTFCRPLGGGIEFGETSAQAVAREIREELGAEVKALRLLGTLENLFVYNGKPGHELVIIYDGEFADPTLYSTTHLSVVESDGATFTATWRSLDEFGPELPLYPEGLAELLARSPLQ
ncbi:NUDIX hydrolase [Metapseudomonas otitidis]|uniref:NUDIX hydrolase n=1 Tax=Metapseudomonas otitidis TaxID=319939 RepID=UPI000D1AAC56|nr:NUDIX hydrolase [Pseudomonas otitidis]